MNQRMSIRNRVSSYTTRRETLEGREHLVVPVVLLVEGVHCGSAGCYYYSPDLLAQTAEAWNGVPVPIYHPYDDQGNPVPCNDPKIIDQQVVGRLFNTHMQGRALKAEIWFDEQRLGELDSNLHNRIKKEEPVEISTGVMPTELGGNGGVWNGEEYIAPILNLTPDHLAVLPDETGACSIEDGCGIRNKEGEKMGTNISKAKSLIENAFGVGDKAIENLARFVALNQELSITELHAKMAALLDSMDTSLKTHYLEELFSDSVIYCVRPGPSAPDGGEPVLLKASYTVHDDDKIELDDPIEVQKKVNYVEIGNEANNSKGGKEKMEKKDELIEQLINCDCTRWVADDKETLGTFNEEQLEKMLPVEQKEAPAAVELAPKEEAAPVVSPEEEEEKPVADNVEDQAASFLKSVPPMYREVLNSGLRLHTQQKDAAVRIILNAPENQFTEEALQTKGLDELTAIAALIGSGKEDDSPSYALNAGNIGGNRAGSEDEDDKPLPIPDVAEAFASSGK